MRYVFCTLGTMGDVRPFVSIAARLTKLGHEITFLTNENWTAIANQVGCKAVSIADPDPPQTARDDFKFFLSHVLPSFGKTFSYIEEMVKSGKRPNLVYRNNMFGASCAAERFALPATKVLLQPSSIMSIERPSWPLTGFTEGPFSHISKYAIPAIYTVGSLFSRYRPYLSRFRSVSGLKPITPWANQSGVEGSQLLLCPTWFAMPQKDWPAHLKTVGFPLEPSELHDLKNNVDFMRESHGSIVMTPGTGTHDPGVLLKRAEMIASSLDRPVVVIAHYLKDGQTSDGMVRTLNFAELSRILPGSAILIHHGGIGTTAEAIRSGVRQLIVADRFDQPDNGIRVAQLGLGGTILQDNPTFGTLISTIIRILSSTRITEQVSTAAALVGGERGLELAVDEILYVSRDSQS